MTREQILAQLQTDYASRREDDRLRHEEREREACAKCDGLRDVLDARRAALMTGVRRFILSHTRSETSSALLPGAMANFNMQVREKLLANGFPVDYLQPTYQCAICRDEGYVYDPSRRMCDCMRRELNERVMAELGLATDRQTFENYDETLFGDQPDAQGVVPRKLAAANRALCERYADGFPDTGVRDLLLSGKSGLGKTYLLRAIQHRVAERGMLPVYVSAYRFFEVARQSYIENNSDLLRELLGAPLLLLDDLGTEPLMNNITITQLFNLLNERQLAGRHTVISTNLTLTELRERYTERVASRFLDASCCCVLRFYGDDVRARRKAGRV